MRKSSFILFAVVIICLMVITIIEKYMGTPYVQQQLYSSPVFYCLWGALSLTSIIYIVQRKIYKNRPTFLLHISFILILVGAIFTALTSQKGIIHLRKGVEQHFYYNENDQEIKLPFSITLTDFIVENYAGTNAPADYISTIKISQLGKQSIPKVVSMNNIAKYKGYRFYQADYDSDNQGSWLSVNRDFWGIPITYAGYFLLFFSFILIMISPKGGFRQMLHHPLLRKGAMVVIFIFLANTIEAIPRVLSTDQAAQFSDMQILHNNRIMPLQTIARDFTLKLTGKTSYRGLTAEQFFTGWIFFPSEWENEPLFEVQRSPYQELLGLKEISTYKEFFTKNNAYKLDYYRKSIDPNSKEAPLLKEVIKLDEKVQLIAMLRSGALLKIFPITINGYTQWYSPHDILPQETTKMVGLLIGKSFDLLLDYIINNEDENFTLVTSKLKAYQRQNAGESLLSERAIKIEMFYNKLPITTILYRINLLLGILGIAFIILSKGESRLRLWGAKILTVQVVLSLLLLSLHIALRTYICGRLPLVNGFDTMVFLGWSVLLLTLIFRRRILIILPFGILMSGFCMLVASLGLLNPQITPLMPVLNSPLLSLHVSTIMISYALFGFTFMISILAIILCRKESCVDDHEDNLLNRLTIFSRLLLYPALVFLGIGIFIGAIWANVSWGRYWAWDPKEVWALISFMIYSLPLHSASLPLFRKAKVFHWYIFFAFFAILMTYFGVNFVLGGMHSYVNS